jgi:uncharacterized protein (DUF3820 family)
MDNINMNTIKTHTGNRSLVTITKTINGEVQKQTYKGYKLNDVPYERTQWFNYKGLTFVID